MPLVVRVGSRVLLMALPTLALAAEANLRNMDPEMVPAATWLWVVALSLGGWLASRGHQLAGWTDSATTIASMLQSVAASLVAGVAAYLGGLYIDAPKAAAFLATIGASYGGSEYLARLKK